MDYGADEHFAFLRELPEFRLELAKARRNGKTDRLVSRAWREYDFRELESFASTERAHRYRTHLETVAKVLPPAFRSFVAVLALNLDAPLDVGPSYRLRDKNRVDELQRRCRLRLAGGSMSSNDRKRLAETLELINPAHVLLLTETSALQKGEIVALNATAAAAGSWIAGPSAAGYPGIGFAADDGTVRVFKL